MAITTAALQAELGVANLNAPQVVRSYGTVGTTQLWYITGGVPYPGKAKFVSTTASDNAATQAAAVLVALATYPAGF